MKSCDICKEKYENYTVNTLGCCSTKYCTECMDVIITQEKCSVCKKKNRFYREPVKKVKSVDQLLMDLLPNIIKLNDFELIINYDFFKEDFEEVCEESDDPRFDDFRTLINLIKDDQDGYNIVKDFRFKVCGDLDDDGDKLFLNLWFEVNDKLFEVTCRSYERDTSQVERRYCILGGMIESLQKCMMNDGFVMLKGLLE